MTQTVKQAVTRLENELAIASTQTITGGSIYAQFLADLQTLVNFVKKPRKRKRRV